MATISERVSDLEIQVAALTARLEALESTPPPAPEGVTFTFTGEAIILTYQGENTIFQEVK